MSNSPNKHKHPQGQWRGDELPPNYYIFFHSPEWAAYKIQAVDKLGMDHEELAYDRQYCVFTEPECCYD